MRWLLAGLSVAYAHNWINTPSRAEQASTFRPCLPRLDPSVPHAQIGPGQEFEIEWSTGHPPSYFYFFTINADDYDNLNDITQDVIDWYLANAPVGSSNAQDPYWRKYHRSQTTNNGVAASQFNGTISSTDARYIVRSPRFDGMGLPAGDAGIQWNYNDADVATDVRVAYHNARYPWLLGLSKFLCAVSYPSQSDVARFTIPSDAPPGKYIVHYYWGGYHDCIDIDYVASPVQYIYGVPTNVTKWLKVDHCYYPTPAAIRTQCKEVITSPVQCQRDCEGWGDPRWCNGINVVPLRPDRNVYFKDRDLIPWDDQACKGVKTDFDYALNNTLVCFGVQARDRTDVITQYVVSDDPEDSVFFSTCYVRSMSWEFPNITPPPKPQATPWIFSDQCISCEAAASNYNPNFTFAPRWATQDQCVNCGQFPAQPQLPSNAYETIIPVNNNTGGYCDGDGGWWRASYWNNTLGYSIPYHNTCPLNTVPRQDYCEKDLAPLGSTWSMLEECTEMAARDRECGDTVMYHSQWRICRCYLKKSCCLTCSPYATNTAWGVYKLQKYSLPADPTCAHGILDITNTSCCAPTCTQCGSTIDQFTNRTVIDCQNLIGTCCPSLFVNRSCSMYSAPCVLP
jgi:hypothetical protein